jgi:hypothetical protein
MFATQVLEKSRKVIIPRVGNLLRVEQRSVDGELLGVEYRRLANPECSAIDYTLNFVVFVTAANTFNLALRFA